MLRREQKHLRGPSAGTQCAQPILGQHLRSRAESIRWQIAARAAFQDGSGGFAAVQAVAADEIEAIPAREFEAVFLQGGNKFARSLTGMLFGW